MMSTNKKRPRVEQSATQSEFLLWINTPADIKRLIVRELNWPSKQAFRLACKAAVQWVPHEASPHNRWDLLVQAAEGSAAFFRWTFHVVLRASKLYSHSLFRTFVQAIVARAGEEPTGEYVRVLASCASPSTKRHMRQFRALISGSPPPPQEALMQELQKLKGAHGSFKPKRIYRIAAQIRQQIQLVHCDRTHWREDALVAILNQAGNVACLYGLKRELYARWGLHLVDFYRGTETTFPAISLKHDQEENWQVGQSHQTLFECFQGLLGPIECIFLLFSVMSLDTQVALGFARNFHQHYEDDIQRAQEEEEVADDPEQSEETDPIEEAALVMPDAL